MVYEGRSEDEVKATLWHRYTNALGRCQTGVAFYEGRVEAGLDERFTAIEPKHLRVGITSTQIDHAALMRLLFKRGIVTEIEYLEELADEAERAADEWQEKVRQTLDAENVTLDTLGMDIQPPPADERGT